MSTEAQSKDRYLCGWRVRSAIDLPELAPWTDARHPVDIEIVRDALPSPRSQHRRKSLTLEVRGPSDVLLELDDVAKLRIVDGRHVTVDVSDRAYVAMARLVLLGTGLATLAFQRGLLPLHAAALCLDDRAVAIAGRSGSGKSTLAASLALDGVPILGDDVCVVDTTGAEPRIWPSVARIKLRRDAIDRLGIADRATARVAPDADKLSLSIADNFPARPVPLAALCLLTPNAPSRLSAIGRTRAVHAAVYRRWLGELLGARRFMAQTCMTIVSGVPVFTLPARASLTADELRAVVDAPLRQAVG